LIKNGLLKRRITALGEVKLELTSKGKWETSIRSSHKDLEGKTWDGVWRIVVFDVPEAKSKLRTELRRAMRMYGFVMLQRSVWVYPHACDDFISLIKSHLGISHDVLYLTATYIENDTYLRREFKI
jgi:phenylacetic acid degradation operon negative regulatory protein